MAGRVLWHTSMNLDGYIADQDDSLNWAFGHDGAFTPALEEFVARIGPETRMARKSSTSRRPVRSSTAVPGAALADRARRAAAWDDGRLDYSPP